MKFEWDENKRKINYAKHNENFADVEHFDFSNAVTSIDDRFEYKEKRYIAYGYLFYENILRVAIFTIRKDAIRIISFRKANARERSIYGK